MGSLMQDLKRQASFFLREKFKTARLVLTDVTPVQLLTEEVTNGGDSLAPDAHSMGLISRAAFEVDDYDRIVHILHHRLSKFDTWNWRASYNALVVLEYLLTHGPQRIAEEFQCDQDAIKEMAIFHYVDGNGFDWGSSVKRKSERIIELLEDMSYLKEERARARKVSVGIKGFGSFSHRVIDDAGSENPNSDTILRSNSLFFGARPPHHHRHHAAVESKLLASLVNNETAEDNGLTAWTHAFTSHEYVMEDDHPFWDKEHQTRVSLLSSI